MGWMFTERPRDVSQYFWDKFHWETETAITRPLRVALKLNVCYAAIETVQKADGKREVWCAVYAIKYIRGDEVYNFGHKDMCETMGPVQDDCPKAILDLLTDTDNDTANEWRERCRKNLEKVMPKIGSLVRFTSPVRFHDGTEHTEFEVVRVGRRRKLLKGSNGFLYQVPRRYWRHREWALVSP